MVNISDPTGWSINNNPNPNKYVSDPTDPKDWRNWHEWDKDSHHSIKCHNCIRRAELDNGNCVDGGEYFICLPKEVREGKVPYVRPKKTVQSTLF